MYTIDRNGDQFGPYDAGQVIELIAKGQLRGTDLAWSGTMDNWQPLACIPEFSGEFASKPKLMVPASPGFGQQSAATPHAGFAAPPPSSALLVSLCVLAILWSIFGILRGLLYQAIGDIGTEGAYWRGWAFAGLNAGTLVGVILMMSRSFIGLIVFSAFQVLYIGLVVLTTYFIYGRGLDAFAHMVGAFFWLPSAILLLLFWLPDARRPLR